MKQVDRLQINWLGMVTVIIMLFVLIAATYAWFTQNRHVETDSVTARAADENVTLEISEEGGAAFQDKEEAAIIQVNKQDKDVLMPVSTDDLNSFVTNKKTSEGMAKDFKPVENEEEIYHGRVYIRANVTDKNAASQMSLYLDESSKSAGKIVQSNEQNLLNATRLGIKITGTDTPSTIFYLSDKSSAKDDQAYNTQINGQTLGDGKVLSSSAGSIRVVNDPSVSLKSRAILETDNGIKLPDTPLATIKAGEIYAVDIYFYLEGCDPDCSDAVSYNEANMHLALFGIMKE